MSIGLSSSSLSLEFVVVIVIANGGRRNSTYRPFHLHFHLRGDCGDIVIVDLTTPPSSFSTRLVHNDFIHINGVSYLVLHSIIACCCFK